MSQHSRGRPGHSESAGQWSGQSRQRQDAECQYRSGMLEYREDEGDHGMVLVKT